MSSTYTATFSNGMTKSCTTNRQCTHAWIVYKDDGAVIKLGFSKNRNAAVKSAYSYALRHGNISAHDEVVEVQS